MCKKLDNYFNNYFVAVYDEYDNYVTDFENIEATTKFFNLPLKEILRKLRENSFIIFHDRKLKLYLVKKEKNIENVFSR